VLPIERLIGQSVRVRQSHVNETYDLLATRYDDWSARVVPALREVWARKVDDYAMPGERVVELGCGTGVPVGRLLSEQYEYEGVDASAEMLARARTALPSVPLTHADMLTVEFPAGSVGGVVSFYAISHIPRERHAGLFGLIASWLRPGGVFVGNLTSRDDVESFEASWLNAGPMRWSGFDEFVNRRLLADAGFRMIEDDVVRQVEPDGCEIAPMWFVAQRA
jgi:ubiquinone/menaquinone biosynthesis C-methylase UbiE